MDKQITSDIVYSQSNNFIESKFVDFSLIELKIIELSVANVTNKDKALIAKKQNKIINIGLVYHKFIYGRPNS